MARPLRLEYAGALYHVTSRGDRCKDIYIDDDDRTAWLEVLGNVCARFNWVVHAYCLMTNHYHLLVETVDGNLSRGMRQLNGQYTQSFNRRHRMIGHLFQGRYKAIVVQKETYLLELSRYVVLTPIRAGMVRRLEDWSWSSYRASASLDKCPPWLDTDWLMGQFGKRRKKAIEKYRNFILEGSGASSPLNKARHQLLLGDDAFVEQHRVKTKPGELRAVSTAPRKSLALPLEVYKKRYRHRQEAMARAYLSGAYTMREIGEYFGVHYMTVSRAVRQFEAAKG
jgi:putative transposase